MRQSTHSRLFAAIAITAIVKLSSANIYPAEVARPTPYAPEAAPECALIVPASKPMQPLTPGLRYLSNYVPSVKRSSYYPNDGQVCITYEDVNAAVYEARKKLGNYIPREVYELSSNFPRPPHIAVPAEIVQEATRILTEWFGLSLSTVLFLLPRLDTYKTAVREICPTFLQPVKCEIGKYRTLTGMCNNLEYPSWGSSRSAMVRFLPPAYADGISVPRASNSGAELPSARVVSFVVHHDISERDVHVTSALIAFGQLIDHDMTLAVPTTDSFGSDLMCCGKEEQERHPNCLPISVPADDPFYKFFKRTCMDFVRVQAGLKPGCPFGPRAQINAISAFIDGNSIYGSSQEVATRLRSYAGGRLKTSAIHKDIGLKDLLPLKTLEPDQGCERTGRSRKLYCFEAGDERANEQITLTVLHTLWMREHNRIADYFAAATYWDDETIYQETRRIMIAQLQHIVFNEFLPVILGRKLMHKYGLDLVQEGFYGGYDTKVNAGIRLAFQAAAFRFGHSILPDTTERYNKFHEKLEAIRLSQVIRQPYDLYRPGVIDTFVLGTINQEAARMDPEITTEVTNHLFEKPGTHFGTDLAALNVQRGRETGLPGYNAFREYCGLPRAYSFHDLLGSFDNRTIHRFSTLYATVDDIDLFSAGVAEYPAPGAMTGPVFSCIMAEQFANVRRGDRFWYENHGWPSSFNLAQLNEIRKTKFARTICDNSDDVATIQLFPMLRADPTSNPRVACNDLPYIDLSKFIEGLDDNLLKKKAKAAKAAAAAA
ncbi:Chorion peroxidase [Halotydeus destructor]|nr:Chorion peroxidase [Halotydeus destructor]